MKTFLTSLCILFVLQTSAQQKIEILFVGAAHVNPPAPAYYNKLVTKIATFKPAMVFGEFLSPADLSKLSAGNYGYDRDLPRIQYIAARNPTPVITSAAQAKKYHDMLQADPTKHMLRSDLAVYYLLQGDFANGMYQVFRLYTVDSTSLTTAEKAYIAKCFGERSEVVRKGLLEKKSEYYNVFYPLIQTTNLNYMHAMDCQTNDGTWAKAWRKMDSAFQVLQQKAKADTSSAEAHTLALIDKYMSYTEAEGQQFATQPYESMNTDRYKTLDAAMNFYGGQAFLGFPGYPTQELKAMTIPWIARNEGMCTNILQQARAAKAGRIVIAVGASHVKIMEEMLQREPGVKLVNLNDL
ncbi:hypothetical protein LX64_00842 [Chitinophaga skermanii]|uniref:Uncharacterized protein n=1 Tax=Chitinophaga skermanii TaxID=331697 RepID=A0A327QW77_9BACT|nr:DUF5694 domain-containing protein [Chitinophaga skermanii]RAJ08195.1 hypothetical protein LX64_00842 [Chitinophaga skermanii]